MVSQEKLAKKLCKEAYCEIFGGDFNMMLDNEEDGLELIRRMFKNKDEYINNMVAFVLENKYFKEVKYAGTEFVKNEITRLLDSDSDWKDFCKAFNW